MRETGITTVTCNLCLDRSISLCPTQLEKMPLGDWFAAWYQIGEIDVCPTCTMRVYSAQKLGIISDLVKKISIRQEEQR